MPAFGLTVSTRWMHHVAFRNRAKNLFITDDAQTLIPQVQTSHRDFIFHHAVPLYSQLSARSSVQCGR